MAVSGRWASAEEPRLFDTRLDYSAAPGCPTASEFSVALKRRSPRIRLTVGASGDSRGRELLVRIERRARGDRDRDRDSTTLVEGHLTIRDGLGDTLEKTVRGEDCSVVASSLALVASVALDPVLSDSMNESKTEAPAPAQNEGSNSDSGARPTSAAGPAPSGTPSNEPAERRREPVAPARESAPEPAEDQPSPSAEAERRNRSNARNPWHLLVGVGGELVAGPAPHPLFATPLFVGVAREGQQGINPSARLRFEHSSTSTQTEGVGAEFSWTVAGVDLCPLAVPITSTLRFVPCARTVVGVMAASGFGVTPERSETRPWASVGAVGRLHWSLTSVFFLEFEGSLAAALVRDRFFIEPNQTLFQPSTLEGSLAISVGASFP